MNTQGPELADIFRRFGDQYRKNHPLSEQQLDVMHAIELCRTPLLGGHPYACDHCGNEVVLYNSCRNRHCPKCQALDKMEWLDARKQDVLPVPYFHVVFTVPHHLQTLFRGNQKFLYNLLFNASAQTLLQIAADPRHLGAKIGFTGVLHTWGSDLVYHPHIHYIVPAGGLATDPDRWVAAKPNFFLNVHVLSKLFRGKFIALLERANRKNELVLEGPNKELQHPVCFEGLIDTLYGKKWVVYCKKPFDNSEHVFKYIARYTHRIAIANSRLISLDGDNVSFRYKDYKNGGAWKVRTLTADEFIRRFLQHVLPKRFVRIRHYGLLANRTRKDNLERARALLGAQTPAPAPQDETWQDKLYRLIGIDPTLCPKCGQGRLRPRGGRPTGRWTALPPRAPP